MVTAMAARVTTESAWKGERNARAWYTVCHVSRPCIREVPQIENVDVRVVVDVESHQRYMWVTVLLITFLLVIGSEQIM